MKTILYNPIFINPQAYYVFPRLTRYLQPDNESTSEPANYIGTIEVKVIAYGDTTLKRTYTNTDSIDLSEFKNTWIRISLFTKVGSCVLGEWKIGNMESDLPYIDPEVLASLKAVVIVGNKTNNDSDRAIVKNLVDPDNPFVISNAAFKLNSGFGKYEDDFTNWVAETGTKLTSDKITNSNPTKNWIAYRSSGVEFKEMHIRILGIPDNGTLYFQRPAADGGPIKMFNGDNNIPAFTSTGICGFFINNLTGLGWSNLVIEQIPSFEDAFVTDGIDDLITSTKTVQEMGITEACTVISMIHQIDKPSNYITTNNIRTPGSVVGRNAISEIGKTGIYGWYKDNIQGSTINVINNILGDKAVYTVSASSNTTIASKFYVVGYASDDSINETSSVAWYWTIIANKVLTTDQINQVIAYFNLDRTLNPDILCDIEKQGITNENHAEFGDKLIDFSGNGRDIQLNNIAWKGDSGIGKYEVDFLDSSIWNSSNSTITSSKIDCKNAISHIMLLYYSVGSKEYPDIPSFKVIKTGADIDYSYIDETGSPKSVRIVDGVNVLPASHNTLYSGSGRFCGFGNPGMGNSVTITQIPSHAGGLCLDGVNDFGKVTGMPIYKDYTFIIDRQIISIGDTNGIVASKSESATDTTKQGAFLFEYLGAPNNISTWSFYNDNHKVGETDFTKSISYQSKYSYNGKELTVGEAKDSDKLWLGTLRDKDSRFANVAIYSLMSFPYSMSEFLIERQLKKHKLGTLYPDMVEFRPVINSNVLLDAKPTFVIRGTNTYLNAGDYVPENSQIWVSIKMNNAADRITKFTVNGKTIDIPENAYSEVTLQYGFPFVIDKSPQKIGITIEQDENYVLFNPVIKSNVEYHKLDFYLNNFEKRINIGDYIPKDVYIRANFYLKNNVDELTVFTFNGVNIDYRRSIVDDTAFNIGSIYNYDSPQEVNITIDEYIRYEDIKQPYPVLLRFNDENGNEVSWGGKFKVGSTITRIGSAADSNLLPNIYNIFGLLLNDNQVTSSKVIVEKTMVFKAKNAYIFDNNEPKCILSPRLLRIPNSSYKLLGYIPDISGHGNHGVIHNSAYAEGSGVNEDGSYQFDGVDDFVTIPTVAGKQVLMKLNWQNEALGNLIYDQRDNGSTTSFAIMPVNINDSTNNKIAYQARNANGITYIDGIRNEYIESYSLENIIHNITITNPDVSNKTVALGASNRTTADYFAKYALYDFMLFDEISTDDKIKELNEYVGIEAKVELPPYYWDTYGKTNSDADRDTIQQRGVAVGDYDLINYNHAYEGMSGYNGYPVVFGESKTWEAQGTKDGDKYYIYTSNANKFNITQIKISSSLFYTYIKRNGELTSGNKDTPSFNLKVTGLDYDKFYLAYYYLKSADVEVRNVINITSDGIYELPKSFASDGSLTETNSYIGLSFARKSSEIPDIIQNVNVTIEVLPEYENGLVYDGVEDYSKNANIPVLTDYTYIYKRTIINIPTNAATLLKGADKTNGGAFIADYGNKWQFNFGQYNIIQGIADGINWQTVNSFNGTSINKGENTDDSGITVSKFSNGYASTVFYKLILYPKTISLLEINFLKNLMEKDEIIDLTNPIFIQE